MTTVLLAQRGSYVIKLGIVYTDAVSNRHGFMTLKRLHGTDIYRLFHGWWARTIFIHKLCKTNERAQRVSLFYTTSE